MFKKEQPHRNVNVTVGIQMCLKKKYKDYISQTHIIYFSSWVYMGDMFRPRDNLDEVETCRPCKLNK